MALLDNYRQGSYRGIPFDSFSWTRTKVKKYTEHQYSNSERRYIEERGVQQPDFSVTMSIFGGDDYISKRDSLRKALETEGTGVLVLPFEGEFNVKCVDFSDSQEILESLGRCDFTATFKVVSENETSGNPIVVKNTKITLSSRVKSLRDSVANLINKNMLITNATSHAQALRKLNTFASKMITIANQSQNGNFSNLIQNFASSIPNFLGGNISILGSAISTLFYTFESVNDGANFRLSSSENLFDYGADDKDITPTTPSKKEQQQNKQLLDTTIKINAVGIASNAFADKDFANEDELKKAQKEIEDVIENILNSEALKNNEIEGVEDIASDLKDLQVDFSDVVAEKELITPKIKEIEVYKESVSMIAYKYYDSINNVDSLIDLNNITNPKQITGKMKVFTNE